MPRSISTLPRSYVNDFEINLGEIITTKGKLIKITKTGSNDYRRSKMICPDCTDATEVFQQYVCTVNPSHVHPAGECDKAKDVDGALVRVAKEDLVEARTSDLPLNKFYATAHPSQDVVNTTWDGDNAYLFVPDTENDLHKLLLHLVSKSGRAFVAMCNIRNNEGLWRLDTWRGHLVVQKLYWPDECNEFDENTIECPDAFAAAAQGFLDKITRPFNADEYRSGVKERLVALEEAISNGTPVPARPAAADKKEWNSSLLHALEAFGS